MLFPLENVYDTMTVLNSVINIHSEELQPNFLFLFLFGPTTLRLKVDFGRKYCFVLPLWLNEISSNCRFLAYAGGIQRKNLILKRQ